MSDPMLHPAFETLSAREIRELQESLWGEQWAYLRENSEFYKRKLGRRCSEVLSLSDLASLPFTEKDELRRSQEARSPFGDYVACAEDQIVRLHQTSGTTGRPLYLANTRRDVDLIARVGGRSQFSAGLRPSDRVVHCLNYCMWTGGVTDHATLEEVGACVIPFGVGNTNLLLSTIERLGISAISCTPSYPALLEKVLRAEGRDPRDLNLRIGLFGGEPGLDNLEFRRTLEESWGFAARNANYGMSEVLSNFASQCERSGDLHFHGADAIFVEIIDSDGNPLPIQEGTAGELVCTHLSKECQPLLRFRTKDVVVITGVDPCECGRTTWRFRVTGRTDDMFNVRGVNVFPSAVQRAVFSCSGLVSGQFRIVLAGSGPWDRIVVRAEAAHGLPLDRWDEARRSLEAAIRSHTGASAEVTIVPTDSLPRTDGKTSLVERI